MLLLLTKSSKSYQIWIMKPNGSEQRKLLEEDKEIASARWAPTGDAIYYIRTEGDTRDLVKLSVSGQSTTTSVLVSGLQIGDFFTLSADGTQLAYTRTQSYSNLWLAELPTHGATAKVLQKPLTSGTLVHGDPSVSPDGRWVALTSGSSTKSNIYKMTIDGSEPVQLTFFEAALSSSPAWSPDGRQIAFICDQGGTPKVWLVSGDGGATRSFDKTNASATNNRIAWSPHPEIIYQQPALHNLRRLNPETQNEGTLLPPDDARGWLIGGPNFSPDGKKFAILWNRGDKEGLWIVDMENHLERSLLPGLAWPLGWSPDAKFIFAYMDGAAEILQIPLEESEQPGTITIMPGQINSGTVSPDGRKIIVEVREDKSDVWLMKDFDPQVDRGRHSDH
jgi:TolB protein